MMRLLAAIAVCSVWASTAHATCCSADPDCPDGFACLVASGGGTGTCIYKPIDCHCDSDCPEHFRCMQKAVTRCSVSEDAQECKQVGLCAAPWQAPCATDDDCGAGFQCAEDGEVCSDGGCHKTWSCAQSGLPDTCATDDDCPSGWSCEDDDAWKDQCVTWTGGCSLNGMCPPRLGKNVCRPPYWALVDSFEYSGQPPAHDGCEGAVIKPKQITVETVSKDSGCQVFAGSASDGLACASLGLWFAFRPRRRGGRASKDSSV